MLVLPKFARAVFASLAVVAALGSMDLRTAHAEDTAPATAPQAPVTGPDPAAVAAAADLMDAIGGSNNFDNMLAMLKKHSVSSAGGDAAKAEEKAQAFDKMLDKFSSYKKQMMDETIALYAARFTAAEMKLVADFYRSGPGKKFIAEMPNLMEQAGDIGQKYAVQIMKDLKGPDASAPEPAGPK